MKNQRLVYLAAIAASLSTSATAQVLFSENFDGSTGLGWNVNAARPGPDRALFGFDYGALGIPAAPGSGGSTQGLLLQANRSGGVQSGVSVSPTGQSFTGDYQLRYQLWHNFNGPMPAGGSGSTQVSGGGIGTAGTTPQWAAGAYDSLFFGATGDGGSTIDYRVYPVANVAGVASGYYAAGTGTDARNNIDPYYSVFGGESAPAGQLSLFAQQTGATGAGAQGFAWRDVAITKIGNTVTWDIDGVRIATVDTSTLTFGGGNILLNHFDINATSSTDVNADSLLFGLFDNVSVTVVPEPSTYALMLTGLAALVGLRRRRA